MYSEGYEPEPGLENRSDRIIDEFTRCSCLIHLKERYSMKAIQLIEPRLDNMILKLSWPVWLNGHAVADLRGHGIVYLHP